MANPVLDPNAPAFTRRYMNLADPRLGAQALFASDEFFAPKERMLDPQPAVFIPGKYDDNGKWMDGWETRRKRTTGHDFCIVNWRGRATNHGVDLDTSHFTGNFPPAASIDACKQTATFRPTTPTGASSCRQPRCKATSTTITVTMPAPIRTCASISIRTAALRVCACTAGRSGTGIASGAARAGSRGDRKRRLYRRSEQPAFRAGLANADARPRRQHGRRLGNAAPS